MPQGRGTNWSQAIVIPTVFLTLIVIGGVIFTADKGVMQKNNSAADSAVANNLSSYAVNWGVPDMTITDTAGNKLLLSELVKTTTLLTVWSLSCYECETGLKDLQTFHENNSSFPMVLLNYRDLSKDATATLTTLGVNIQNYYDLNGESYDKLQATIPSSFFVKDGKIIYYFPGRISTDLLGKLLSQR